MIKLPLLCNKTPNLSRLQSLDSAYSSGSSRKSSLLLNSDSMSDFECDLYLLYEKRNLSMPSQRAVSTRSILKSSQKPKSNSSKKSNVAFIKKNFTQKSLNEVNKLKDDGDLKYIYTDKNGLEVKKHIANNILVVDIFTPDVYKENEKTQIELENRLKEDEERFKQNLPSTAYQKQLNEFLKTIKKGALTYDDWARQHFKIEILKNKIKIAKNIEIKGQKERIETMKRRQAENNYQTWKMSKAFTINKKL